jgi:acylphosphatase
VSAKRFIVRGRVQGVNFRAAAAHEAQRLALNGRIWNREDGAVEAEAEGTDDALARFETWLQRGPRHAQVTSVDAEPLAVGPRYRGFSIG